MPHQRIFVNHGISAGKESTCKAGDPDSIPGFGRSPGEGIIYPLQKLGFPGGSDGKESTCSAGDTGVIPEFGRSPGGGNGYPYFCLENSKERGAWQASSPWGCKESNTSE